MDDQMDDLSVIDHKIYDKQLTEVRKDDRFFFWVPNR